MLKLLNDSGNPGPQTAFATGNVVENTQCAVTAQATQIAGANLQYTVNVQAKQGFDGEKSIWLAASDAAGAASVWRPSGTWAAQGGSSFAASDPGIYNDNLTRAVQLIRPGYSNLDYRTLTSCRYYDSQTNQLANNVTVIYDSATVATINLRITANYIAAPKLTYKFHCWGFTGSAANPVRNDAWQEGLTPLYDVTPTVISSSPSPVELDTNSERVFQVDGYGFGRATPVVEISPANGGLSVVRVDFLSLPDGRPTPHARFSLRLRGGANPGSYTIRLVSVGSGISNQFQAGPASQAISATYPVVVKAPQFRISLRGQPVTEGQTLWIDSADPTMPFRASLTSLNATGNFRFKATSRHKDTGDLGPEFVQEEERSGSCPMGVGSVQECEFFGLVAGGNVSLSWRLDASSTWNPGPNVIIKGLRGPGQAAFQSYVLNVLQDNPWFYKYLPFGEQLDADRFSQFKANGDPDWGTPRGYGIMKVELPGTAVGNATWPPITTMFNWRANLDRAHASLWGDKKPVVDQFWQDQIEQWGRFNLASPTPADPPPDTQEGNCTFRFGVAGPDQQARIFTTEDALWIKAYNGAQVHYMYFNESAGQWVVSNANGLGFNYVQRVCAGVQ